MSTAAIYVRVPRDLLYEFDLAAQSLGMTRSEAIREAMRLFIRVARAPTVKSLRGMASSSRIPAERLDRLALV